MIVYISFVFNLFVVNLNGGPLKTIIRRKATLLKSYENEKNENMNLTVTNKNFFPVEKGYLKHELHFLFLLFIQVETLRNVGRNNGSPAEELLRDLGYQLITVRELIGYLAKLNHQEALLLLKPTGMHTMTSLILCCIIYVHEYITVYIM